MPNEEPLSDLGALGDLSVGIPEIDRQHRMLLERLEFLGRAIGSGQGDAIVNQLITDLAEYAREHFRTEELLFEKHGYPGWKEHEARHADFMRRADRLCADLERGKRIEPNEVQRYLSTWVREHLATEDMKYREFFRMIGIGVRT